MNRSNKNKMKAIIFIFDPYVGYIPFLDFTTNFPPRKEIKETIIVGNQESDGKIFVLHEIRNEKAHYLERIKNNSMSAQNSSAVER